MVMLARHGAGVAVGSDGGDLPEPVEGATQHGDAGGVDAVVVGEEDLEGHAVDSSRSPAGLARSRPPGR